MAYVPNQETLEFGLIDVPANVPVGVWNRPKSTPNEPTKK